MTLNYFPEQVAWFPPEKMWGAAVEGRPTGPAQSERFGKVLEQRQAEEGRRQSLGPGTKTPTGIPPTHTQNLKLLSHLQATDSSFLSGKDFARCFLKLWKITQLVSEAKKTGSLICSSSLETVFLFSAVRVGGNFSACIITGDISGHDYLRS